MSLGEVVAELTEGADIDIIECEEVPSVGKVDGKKAYVYVKFRYVNSQGTCSVVRERFCVRRFDSHGWRIVQQTGRE